MRTYEAFASISAPPDEVWRVLSDVVAWPDWLPTVTAVEALDSRPLRLGSRFVVRQPKLRPATWAVTEMHPPNHFVWIARSPGVVMTAQHVVARQAPSACRLLLRFSFTGPLGGIVGWIFRAITDSYLAQEAASLKRRAEAGNGGRDARGEFGT